MSSLQINGACTIYISAAQITSDIPIKLTRDGDEYQIECEDCIFIGNGNMVQMGGSSFSQINGGRSVSQVNGVTYVNSGGPVYINGVLHNPNSDTPEINEDPNYKGEWDLDASVIFTSISIRGSATVCPIKERISSNFSAAVSGSGDLQLPEKEFDCLNLSVTGSGDISGNNTSADILNMNVTGSGNIEEIICRRSGTANVTGSGDISAYKILGAHVSRNCIGSGGIEIRQLDTSQFAGNVSGGNTYTGRGNTGTVNQSAGNVSNGIGNFCQF